MVCQSVYKGRRCYSHGLVCTNGTRLWLQVSHTDKCGGEITGALCIVRFPVKPVFMAIEQCNSLKTSCSQYCVLYQQISCQLLQQQTATERAMGRTASRCPASRTPSARPLRRHFCSWTTVQLLPHNLWLSQVWHPRINCVQQIQILSFFFMCSQSDCSQTCAHSLLFQMRKEGRRKRKNRNFCSAHPWFTQNRQH